MTSHEVRGFRDTDAQDLLQALVAPDPPPFALLRRACAGGHEVEVLTGKVAEVGSLAELPSPGPADAGGGGGGPAEVLAVIPYRQVTERGYACNDDGEPILALTAERRAALPVKEALDLLPDAEVALRDAGSTSATRTTRRSCRRSSTRRSGRRGRQLRHQALLRRHVLGDYRPEAALTVFRRLLTSGVRRVLDLPRAHRRRAPSSAPPPSGTSASTTAPRVMNPISGTYRYPPSGPDLDGVLDFLADRKETDELYMVVDEELKMMARVCDRGGRARGPVPREMAQLAHTEYLIEGAPRWTCARSCARRCSRRPSPAARWRTPAG